jgi:S1-C subfamily serine protease
MGLRIEELQTTRARRPRAYPNRQGVIVADVAPASFGEDIDFLPGDLITQINRMDVASVADYRRAVAAMKPGAEMVFRILREEDGGRILTIFLAGVVPPAER